MPQLKPPSDSRFNDNEREACDEEFTNRKFQKPSHGEFDAQIENWAESLAIEKILNTTSHDINFREENGTEFIVRPCGFLLNAKPEEEEVKKEDGISFVRTKFVADPVGERFLAAIIPLQKKLGGVIVGSIIAAQTYPGKVAAMTPAKGFERVPIDQKRMNPLKFTIF